MCSCNGGNRYRDNVNIFLKPNFVSPDHESRCSLNTVVLKEKFHCMSSKHYNIIRCYKQQKWALKNKFVHICASFYFVVLIIPSFVFWAVIFIFHSVWWQLPLFEYDKFGDTGPLTVYLYLCTITNYNMKVHHRSYRGNFCSCEKKAWKKLYRIRTLDLCDTSAVLLLS